MGRDSIYSFAIALVVPAALTVACAVLFADGAMAKPAVSPVAASAKTHATVVKTSVPVNKSKSRSGTSVQAAGPMQGLLRFDGGVINGKGHNYHLVAPTGWTMDTKTGVVRGIPVIFTPADAAGPDYPTVLYSQIMQRKGRGLDELIDGMVHMMKPGSAITDDFVQPPVKLSESRQAIVRKLPPGKDGNHELVAFIEEKEWLVLIILAGDSDSDVASARPAFESLVKSYSFGDDKVKIQE